MLILSLGLLGLAVADIIRWTPERVSLPRTCVAVAGATTTVAVVAALAGLQARELWLTVVVIAVAVGVWSMFDHLRDCAPGFPLAWLTTTVCVLFAISSSVGGVSGPLSRWYSDLELPGQAVGVDQFLMGVAALLFLMGTSNRLVRLVLAAAGTRVSAGEAALRGGRVLGPMERLFFAALFLAGEPTGAAIVIAAKGLLRLPEIRDSRQTAEGVQDQVTEYFLIGTFASLLLAAAASGLTLALT